MRYDKLVRDKIPEIIISKGGKPVTHVVADKEELKTRLISKLYEEVGEFANNWRPEELADIMEVVRALSEIVGSSPELVEFERQKKAQEKGGLSEGIVLDEA